MLAGLAFCEMQTQRPEAPFQGLLGVAGGESAAVATQTLRVHLLGVDRLSFPTPWNYGRGGTFSKACLDITKASRGVVVAAQLIDQDAVSTIHLL